MAHKFQPKDIHKLEDPQRKVILPPEEILSLIGLRQGMHFADIGAGTGYFSIPASSIVGSKGHIYAIDILDELLEYIQNKINKNNIKNISLHKSTEYEISLTEESIDMAFLSLLIHEIEDKVQYLDMVQTLMKPGGSIIIIDWRKKEMKRGPSLNHRISLEEVKELLAKSKFEKINAKQYNEYFYLIQACK